ncbi:MAG: pilus assembly PilX N-terminal domain-containing protein [Candidatus Aminicenantales bacterium]
MRPTHQCPERGSTLIVVILVIAFMLAVGVAILTVSGTAPKVSGSVRDQEEAFNTAEAGFEAARFLIEGNFFDGLWTNLPDNCFRTPAGIDLPHDANYFQKKTDSDILALVPIPTANNGVLFKDQPFTKTRTGTDDLSRTYTVFLIDDEAGSPMADPSDALLVCIGVIRSGNRILSTSRLEILIGIQTGGTNP